MELKVGQILNFTYSSPFGLAIQLYNLRTYGKIGPTHSGIIVEITEFGVNVSQSLGIGNVISQYGKQELMDIINTGAVKIGETLVPLVNVQDYAKKYVGTPYNWVEIVGIACYSLIGSIAFKIFPDTKEDICSEEVTKILYDSSNKQVDLVTEFGKPWNFITPMDIQNSKSIIWIN